MSTEETRGQTAHEVATEIEPILDVIADALNQAMARTAFFFNAENELPDRYLHPALVRWYAKRRLTESGHDVSEDEPDLAFTRDELANNGLLLSHRDVQVRVLKCDDGELPVPNSIARQGYYSQQVEMRFLENGDVSQFRMNLVLLWDVNDNYELSRLILVYPRSGGRSRTSVEEYWRIELPVPAPATIEVGELEVEVEDLPITLAREEVSETEKPG